MMEGHLQVLKRIVSSQAQWRNQSALGVNARGVGEPPESEAIFRIVTYQQVRTAISTGLLLKRLIKRK